MKIKLVLVVDYTDKTISPQEASDCLCGALEHSISNGMLSGETAGEIEDYGYDISWQCPKCLEYVRVDDDNGEAVNNHFCEREGDAH
jgi:hypothetical protein